MPYPSVTQVRLGPRAVVTTSLALEVQVGAPPGQPGARTRVGMLEPCAIQPEMSHDSRRCRSTPFSELGRYSYCIEERRECRRHLAPTWVIQKEAGERRTPILEHPRQRA